LSMSRRTGGKPRLRDPMLRVERQRFGRRVKHRGLVHVIPETGNTGGNEIAIQRAPPSTRLSAGEIGKYRAAGPDATRVHRAVGPLEEMVACDAAVIGRVALVRR